MVPADHPAFLRILPNGTVRVMGSPQAATAAPLPPDPTPAPKPTHKPAKKPVKKVAKPGTVAKKPPTRSTGAHR
jgi:hypothetical protein